MGHKKSASKIEREETGSHHGYMHGELGKLEGHARKKNHHLC